MIAADPVLNNFISERVTVNSNDLSSLITSGHDSTPWQTLSTYQNQKNRFGCEPLNFAENCVTRCKELTLIVIKRTPEYPPTDEEYA